MARFSTYDAPIGVAGPTQTQRAAAADFGGGGGFGIAGKALGSFADAFAARQEANEATTAQQFLVEERSEWTKWFNDQVLSGPEGISNLTARMSEGLNVSLEEYVKNIRSPDVRNRFNLGASRLRNSLLETAEKTEAKEFGRTQVEAVRKTVSNINNTVTADPGYYDSGDALTDLSNEVENLRRRGVAGAQVLAQEKLWVDELHLTAAKGQLAAAETSKGMAAFVKELADDESGWKTKLAPEDYRSVFETAVKSVEKLRTQEVDKDVKDQTAVVKANALDVAALSARASGGDPIAQAELELIQARIEETPTDFNVDTITRVGRTLRDLEKGDTKGDTRAFQSKVADVVIAIDSGDLTEEGLATVYKFIRKHHDRWVDTGEGIDDTKYINLTDKLNVAVQKSLKENAQVARITQELLNGAGSDLDHQDRDTQAAVATTYGQLFPGGMPSEQTSGDVDVSSMIVEFVRNVGVVPRPLIKQIELLTTRRTPESVGVAVEMLALVDSLGVPFSQQMDSETTQLLRRVSQLNSEGMTVERAIDTVLVGEDVNPDDRKAREKAIGVSWTAKPGTKGVPKSLTKSIKGGDFGAWGSANEGVPPSLVADFRRLATEEYVIHGHFAAAENAALKSLQHIWGPDSSGRLMKRPPHMFYPAFSSNRSPEKASEAIMDSLIREITRNGIYSGKMTKDRLVMRAHDTRLHEGKPVYTVILLPDPELEKPGYPTTIYGGDELWYPDYRESPAYEEDKGKAFNKENLERAKEEYLKGKANRAPLSRVQDVQKLQSGG